MPHMALMKALELRRNESERGRLGFEPRWESHRPAVLIMIFMFEGPRASNPPAWPNVQDAFTDPERPSDSSCSSALIRKTGKMRLVKACAPAGAAARHAGSLLRDSEVTPECGCERMWLLRCAGVLESGVIKALSAEY